MLIFLNKKYHNILKCIHNINTIFYHLKINLEIYLPRSMRDRNKKSWNDKLNLFIYVFF